MNFGEKLKIARVESGLKQSELAKKLGTTGNTISNWENNVSKPDLDTLSYICGVLHVTASYFLQATIPDDEVSIPELRIIKKYRFINEHSPDSAKMIDMVLDREYAIAKQLKEQKERITELEAESIPVRVINYYYRLASAGTGQIIFDMPPTKRIEIPDLPEYRKADYAIGVNGKSMEPTYYDGDTLLVEMTEEIEVGEIGIFSVSNECYVKKLGQNELISLNPECENIALNETAHCMGRVLGKLQNN